MLRDVSHDKFKSQTAPDGTPLHWSPHSPFPFRGPGVPMLRGDEIDELPLRYDFQSQMFQLWEPTQKSMFDRVNDSIVAGLYIKLHRADNWIAEKQHYMVWLEWTVVTAVAPQTQPSPQASGEEVYARYGYNKVISGIDV